MSAKKRRRGDRIDGARVRDLESFHRLLPFLMPKRCDAVAFLKETIDMAPVLAYLEEKNKDAEVRTTLFHVFVSAVVQVFAMRPLMNRFICGKRFYQRDLIDVGFVVKREFSDKGEENITRVAFAPETTIDDVRDCIYKLVHTARTEKSNDTMDVIDFITKLPRPMTSFLMSIFRMLNYYGKMPTSFTKVDPDFASVFISNMGSIKAGAPFHHLNEWGTNSVFLCIGEMKKTPMVNEAGELYVTDAVDFAFTLDERIADGYYYARSIHLLKKLLANPKLLEQPADAENLGLK